jgi:hypothetical protein
MKFIYNYSNHKLYKKISEQSTASSVPSWFKLYSRSGRAFSLDSSETEQQWANVSTFQQLNDEQYNSIKDLQTDLYDFIDSNRVTDKEGEKETIKAIVDKLLAEKNKKPITPERFTDNKFGVLTKTVLSAVIAILQDKGKVDVPDDQLKKAKKDGQEILNDIETQEELFQRKWKEGLARRERMFQRYAEEGVTGLTEAELKEKVDQIIADRLIPDETESTDKFKRGNMKIGSRIIYKDKGAARLSEEDLMYLDEYFGLDGFVRVKTKDKRYGVKYKWVKKINPDRSEGGFTTKITGGGGPVGQPETKAEEKGATGSVGATGVEGPKGEEKKEEQPKKAVDNNIPIKDLTKEPLVSEETKKAILEIESVFSFLSNAGDNASESGIQPRTDFTIDSSQDDQRKYIERTIGLDNWFKMSEDLRNQIYTFNFQSDSGKGNILKMRWIAGLDQSLTGVNKRGDIVLPDANTATEAQSDTHLQKKEVQEAIDRIKKACVDGTINEKYNEYVKVVDEQYQSLDKNASLKGSYKFIWKYRPVALVRLLKGDAWSNIEKDWRSSFSTTSTTGTSTSTTKNKKFDINLIYNSEPFKECTRIKQKHEGKTGIFDFVPKKIVSTYNQSSEDLKKVVAEYNANKVTKDQLSKELDAKLKEARETDTLGSADAEEFKNSAIAMLLFVKTQILPTLS